jgi:hypothetical protein
LPVSGRGLYERSFFSERKFEKEISLKRVREQTENRAQQARC